MIGLSDMSETRNSSASSADAEGLDRLWSDLTKSGSEEETEAPEGLLESVLTRIEAEPPRVETDAEGRITAINPAFIQLCGYTFEELRGRKPGGLLQGPDSDPAVVSQLREAVRQGQGCEANLINYHKDGSPYRVKIELTAVHGEDGALKGFRAAETKLPLA